MPKISVVVATYNRCESLIKALQSIADQTGIDKADYEIIVVDNNSTDKTKEIVEGFKRAFPGNLIYLFEQRQGKTFALNKGIESTRGEIIAMTDDDCVADRNWLANIWKTFSTKNIDLLAGKVIAECDGAWPEWLDKTKLHGPLAHHDKGDKYFENDDVRKILVTGANMIFRRTSVEKFGNFRFSGRSQDTDLAYRWANLGAKIAYSPEAVVIHHNDPRRLTKSYFRKWYFLGGRNNLIIFKENFFTGRSFLGIPLWVFRDLFVTLMKYLRSFLLPRENAFEHEVFLFYYLGIISGCYDLKCENLR
ncbi:MAG: hypothetical protein A3D87_01370 [Omnitrophica WOR_2 bacterium RIFCSPHIGHO2_02_FULL_50_17]|nr:MAG: hypothetical protein A3D87_01370 [Omnitrophica WOR_2 bacterium RIFCSPHIGHO2_02_FULL_50_17]